MTEKTPLEKMLSGEPYSCLDARLEALRMQARRLSRAFNDCLPDEGEKKDEILRKLLQVEEIRFGICEPITFDYGFTTHIGHDVFINHNATFNDNGGITIGDYTMIGHNCSFYTAVHPLDAESRVYALPTDNEKWEQAKPITIGKRCWLGGNVVVLPGVTIGDDAVIGAGSVVTGDIPGGTVAAGNPCRVIKKVNGEKLGSL